MDTLKIDVAVIGAGTAGVNARREVEKRGGRPVGYRGVFERGDDGGSRGFLGTPMTCRSSHV